jgi:hypothetical protein
MMASLLMGYGLIEKCLLSHSQIFERVSEMMTFFSAAAEEISVCMWHATTTTMMMMFKRNEIHDPKGCWGYKTRFIFGTWKNKTRN